MMVTNIMEVDSLDWNQHKKGMLEILMKKKFQVVILHTIESKVKDNYAMMEVEAVKSLKGLKLPQVLGPRTPRRQT
jgi:hypothetical protein